MSGSWNIDDCGDQMVAQGLLFLLNTYYNNTFL